MGSLKREPLYKRKFSCYVKSLVKVPVNMLFQLYFNTLTAGYLALDVQAAKVLCKIYAYNETGG
jgi:hypothetical protein